MAITTVSAQDFARKLAQVKRAAEAGPVVITHRGRPTYALLKIEDYHRLANRRHQNLLEMLESVSCEAGIDYDATRVGGFPRDIPPD